MTTLEQVATIWRPSELWPVVGALESAGIPVRLSCASHCAVDPALVVALGGIHVSVPTEELGSALSILASAVDADLPKPFCDGLASKIIIGLALLMMGTIPPAGVQGIYRRSEQVAVRA